MYKRCPPPVPAMLIYARLHLFAHARRGFNKLYIDAILDTKIVRSDNLILDLYEP